MSLSLIFVIVFIITSLIFLSATIACACLEQVAFILPLLICLAISFICMLLTFLYDYHQRFKKLHHSLMISRKLQNIISGKAENSCIQLCDKFTELSDALTEVKELFNKEAELLGEDPEAQKQINEILSRTHGYVDEAFELLQFEDYISQIREHIHQILQETLNFKRQSIENYAEGIFSIDDEFQTIHSKHDHLEEK